jgi:hypothetical protein
MPLEGDDSSIWADPDRITGVSRHLPDLIAVNGQSDPDIITSWIAETFVS